MKGKFPPRTFLLDGFFNLDIKFTSLVLHVQSDNKTMLGDEETMEDKLKALGILENGEKDTDPNAEIFSTPKADSLQVLMMQALESDDKALLEQCLAVTDEKVSFGVLELCNCSRCITLFSINFTS